MKIHKILQVISCAVLLVGAALAQPTYPVEKLLILPTSAAIEANVEVSARVTFGGPTSGTFKKNWVGDVTLNWGDGTSVPVFTETISFSAGVLVDKTFTHRYRTLGDFQVVLAGTESPPEYTGTVPPWVAFSVSRTLTVAPPRRVPFFGPMQRLAVLSSAAMEWNPRYFQGGAWMMFLSEREVQSKLYFTYKPYDTWAPPLVVNYGSPLPSGVIGGFEISDDGRWLLLRMVDRSTASFYLAFRADGSLGSFGNFRAIQFTSGSKPLSIARVAENEFRTCRGMGISPDGLSIFLPHAVIYPPSEAGSPPSPFYQFTRTTSGIAFAQDGRVFSPDELPRLRSSDGRVRIWTTPPRDPAMPDADVLSCTDGPAPGASVYTGSDAATVELDYRFQDMRTAVDALAVLHTVATPSGPSTDPELELGGVTPDGGWVVFAFADKTPDYYYGQYGEFDLYTAPLRFTAP